MFCFCNLLLSHAVTANDFIQDAYENYIYLLSSDSDGETGLPGEQQLEMECSSEVHNR